MKILVTGGCGFLGSNLASEALRLGHEVAVYDDLSRHGSDLNLAWLREQAAFAMHQADVADADRIAEVVRDFRPDVVFHTAGQVAMTTSLSNPRRDFETNALGAFNVLEALRQHSPTAIIVFSSTNKVYGDLEDWRYSETATRYLCEDFPQGFPETVPLDFRTPYGCSKGAADQYIRDYCLSFGLRSVVFRHSSIFGGRQFASVDQGWIGWFVQQAVETLAQPDRDPFTISGNGKQVRDVLFASDLVACYYRAVEAIDQTQGQAFNIGGGMSNSLSLLELFDLLRTELDVRLSYTELPPRSSDQKVFVADIGKAERLFGWAPRVSKEEGIRQMIDWVRAGR
jgi:CDP-paratose 2-epimerase